MQIREENIRLIRRIALVAGGLFVLSGWVILAYVAYSVWRLIEDPSSVALTQYLFTLIDSGTAAAWGTNDGQEFSFFLSESMQQYALLFIGAILFVLFVSVGKAVLYTGLSLVRFALYPDSKSPHFDPER